MPKKKTATIVLDSIKDPDGWGELISELGLSDEKVDRFFEFAEYACVELEVDEDLRIVGGRILPR